MNTKLFSGVLRATWALLFILISFGCGGGTVGTDGGGSTRILGMLVTASGVPVAGASLTIGNDTRVIQTTESGEFSAEQVLTSSDLPIYIDVNNSKSQVVISDLPENPLEIEVDIELREQNSQALVRKKTVRPRPTPTATPIPTASVDVVPTAEVPDDPIPPPTESLHRRFLVSPSATTVYPILINVSKFRSLNAEFLGNTGSRLFRGKGNLSNWYLGAAVQRRSVALVSKLRFSNFVGSFGRTTQVRIRGKNLVDAALGYSGFFYLSSNSLKKVLLSPVSPEFSVFPVATIPTEDLPSLPTIDPIDYVVDLQISDAIDPSRIGPVYLTSRGNIRTVASYTNGAVITGRFVGFDREVPLTYSVLVDSADGLTAEIVSTKIDNPPVSAEGTYMRTVLTVAEDSSLVLSVYQ